MQPRISLVFYAHRMDSFNSFAGVCDVPAAVCPHFVPHDHLAHAWFFRYGVGKG